MTIWIGFWVVLSLLVGYAASTKGRSGLAWFIVSLFLSPVIGLLIVIALGDRRAEIAKARELRFSRPCPYCAEPIQPMAKVCKHCRHEVQPLSKKELNYLYNGRPSIVAYVIVGAVLVMAAIGGVMNWLESTGRSERIRAILTNPPSWSTPSP